MNPKKAIKIRQIIIRNCKWKTNEIRDLDILVAQLIQLINEDVLE